LKKESIKLLETKDRLQSLLSNRRDEASPADVQTRSTNYKEQFVEVLSRQFPSDFTQKLKKLLTTTRRKNDRGKITMEVAPTQAHPCVANLAMDGDADAIISGDSDFSMFV
jgi:hypothetical protein